MFRPKQNNNNNNEEEEEEEEIFLPPFFDPILASDRKRFFFDGDDDDDCNDFNDDASISSSLCGKKKKKNTTTTSVNKTTPVSCAMNAEINGRFLLLSKDDDMQPDVARILVLDNLFKEDENFGEDDDCVKAFTKALASVRIVGKEEEEETTTKKKNVVVVDVRTSEEAYWERETVDRKGDANKTLGAKPFIVDAASRNGGVEGERMLFERLRKVFPQTVFARAPVESFVFEEEEEEEGEEAL